MTEAKRKGRKRRSGLTQKQRASSRRSAWPCPTACSRGALSAARRSAQAASALRVATRSGGRAAS
eukprot:79546-Rhodomonas_salina.1